MIKITAIAPYEDFANLFVEIFEKHNQNIYKPEYENEDYELEIIMAPGSIELKNMKFNSDVIVARGGIAYHLRQRENFVPVVELPVAGNDLIHALYESKQRFGCKEVAIIGPTNMIMGAEGLSHIVGMDIKTFMLANESDIEEIVSRVVAQGIHTIIGGVKTCAYGSALGANTVFIKSGSESIWQAITEAKRVAYISRREQEKAQRYKTIIDYAYEGVIAIDNQNRISVFNAAAQKTLSINAENAVGKNIENIIPNSKFRDLLSSDRKHLDEIIQYNDIQLAINKVPIILKGENVGDVLTFQDITRIQEMEGKIREKIYTRGHIAKHTFKDIIGESQKIKMAIQTAKKFSQVDSNILIVGETGTGKELFAQSIHNYSPRKRGPFVAVNCAALPENLLESELFGYVEGAFTGAVKGGKPGFFELAHKGTIFLDEISEISPKLQGRLLRVLQEKEIRRIGHDRVIPVDVRVISATNKDLNMLVQMGKFREDLYYRLDVLKISLPPLRERKEDISFIVHSFIKKHQQYFGKEDIHITNEAVEALRSYDWPGNIRQLNNICERLVVLSQSDIIDKKNVEDVLSNNNSNTELFISSSASDFSSDSNYSYIKELKEIERNKIKDALEKAGYNKSRAAKRLGINRTTLWRRMKELNIEDLR
ncbi:MAG: hypothetical protein PWP27_1618 [Clostridiales bacterium]|jgi:PAS domain S-box-containing protein|nr:hypothetical protein [Clostridiales bacterium]MDK2933808.1 hypothetical protein [Clostridiales bacterium]